MSNLNTMPDPYQFLERISTEELQRILREDFESGEESTAENDEFITKVMEVIEKRERSKPSSPAFDPAAGWEDFQKNYYPTEEDPVLLCDRAELEKLTQKHRVVRKAHPASTGRPARHVKRIALVAAAIGVFMTLLVAAQAAGFDVFGAMAQWTNETFRFMTAPTQNSEVVDLCSALDAHGIPTEYAPSWIPDGFVAEELQTDRSKRNIVVSARFSDGKNEIVYAATQYDPKETIDLFDYEKKIGDAIPYMNGEQLFYIFDNTDRTTATWFDGNTLTITICGQISIDDMKSIIDSIGG